MYEVDIFGRKWFTDEEFFRLSAAGEFEKEEVVGHPDNCIPYIDFGKWARDDAAFNEFALPRMVTWVKEVSQKPRATPLHWRDVSAAAVREQKEFLKKYDGCDDKPVPGPIDRKLLLKEIMAGKCGPVKSVRLDLIGILYVDTPFWDTCSVVCANLDDEAGNNLFFQYKHDDTGNVLSYRIRNFKQPHIAHVEFISQSLQ
ncbi:MAG: hypothetical protein LBI47_01930 [Puniceicoccales bacterium]|jgi:hypothetical protein|nr:hypothetical protein [Puniceicoccales bacterium]